MKPIYKYIIGLVVVVLIIVGYVFWVNSSNVPQPSKPATNNNSSTLPVAGVGSQVDIIPTNNPTSTIKDISFIKLSDGAAFDFWVLKDTGEIYYITTNGKVYAAKRGDDVEISNQTVSALNNIDPSLDGKKVLTSFGDPNNPQWGVFDVIDKTWRPLPSDILQASWGTDGDQLIATTRDGGGVKLSFVDLKKTPFEFTTILRGFNLSDTLIKFEAPQTIFVTEKPSYSYSGRFWKLNTKTLDFNLLISPQRGLWIRWNRENNAVFKFFPENNTSFVSDQNNNNEQKLPFIALPSKCSLQGNVVFCFVPENIPLDKSFSSTILPDDYLKSKIYTIDDVRSYDINTKEIGVPFNNSPQAPFFVDGKNPEINNNVLYFINKFDGMVYSADLPAIHQNEVSTSTPSQ
ncbi:MAG: hypothetical protein UW92_C0034G0006 [Candidatus Jorgensenbacteria bacterium GW2011_GWA2_45_13]|uniref:Uncharacterized protein n=1 Tax=Candidatus Jorgensenbacteria bacterium GW2011_GWA2_45_13 TaxID=1618662 RepID=A0A0G1P2H4_9BACT|nr:MAG: hypothetical protein UW92_C0034G0006 [Candidatus Jorgensenbacteria bacterium GW2011_GWA2_45_13]